MTSNNRILARCGVALGILMVTGSCARSLQKVQIVQGAPAVIDELSRLSDRQWHDAFRAGGYNQNETARFVTKIRFKIAQGLALTSNTTMREVKTRR